MNRIIKREINVCIDDEIPTPKPLYELTQLNLKNRHIYYHDGECSLNTFGQCVYGYKYFCLSCNIGLGGMYSTCLNKKCPQFSISFLSDVKDNHNHN